MQIRMRVLPLLVLSMGLLGLGLVSQAWASGDIAPLQGTVDLQAKNRTAIERVQLTHPGYFIPGIINQQTSGIFMVDTAASHTVFSVELARKAGLLQGDVLPESHTTVITANGRASVPIVMPRSLQLGGVELQNLNVIVQDLDKSLGVDGLIGLDVLKNFNVSLTDQTLFLQVAH